ncbi:MAG: SulP family inorganic anion transporter [Anaerolineae bacterium]|nr:SulP family inorganic anion transporter [Anaerolineae bacterium]
MLSMMLSARSRESVVRQVRAYARRSFMRDVTAGITLATAAVPQSMAFAIIAGLNPVYGLYTSVVASIAGSLAGSFSLLSTGPTNALALVVGSTLASVRATPQDELALLFTLTLLVGAFQFGMGALRLGGMARFVSNAVMVGFITGAGLLIAVGQLGNLLGLGIPRGTNPFETILYILTHLSTLSLASLGVGVLTIAVMLALRRTRLNLLGPLLGIVIAAVLVAAFHLQDAGVRIVSEISPIPNGLPPFTLLRPIQIPALAPQALAIALLGLVQSASIVQSLAPARHEHPDASQEFVGQGLANIAGAFFQCMPAGGSLSRTAVNVAAGARTRMAGVFSGVFVGAVLLVFGPLAELIPMPALAGLLIIVAFGLIDRERLLLVWRTAPTSRAVFLVTLAATLVFPLEYSIYIGALLSIGNYLQASSHPHVARLVPVDSTFREVAVPEEAPEGSPILISVTGNLHFAAIQDIEENMPDLTAAECPIIILRLRGAEHLASTGISFLASLLLMIHERHGELLLCGVEPSVVQSLRRSGLMVELGEANVFHASDMLLESTQAALRRARELQCAK